MELQAILIVAMTSLFIGIVASTINCLFESIVRLFFTVVHVKSDIGVRDIDNYLLKKTDKSDVCILNSTIKPIDTFHFRMVGWGLIVAIRKESSYMSHQGHRDVYYVIYSLGSVIHNLKECQLFLDCSVGTKTTMTTTTTTTKRIKISNFESSTPWNADFLTNNEEILFDSPFRGQEKCIRMIRESGVKSILLCGNHGVGKTNVSIFLAKEIGAHVIFGYDLTSCGVLRDLWGLNRSKEEPVILVLDEIDGAFAYAEKNTPYAKFRTHAQNKTAFNTLFDRFERTMNLIIIGTTNKTIEYLEATYPSYIRKGRFDLRVTLTRNDCILEQ
jgi:hypothetical protein